MGFFKRLFGTPRAPRAVSVGRPGDGPSRVRPPRAEPDWRSYDWSDVAPIYADVLAPLTTEPYRDLLDLAARTADASILDIGTGTGDELAGLDGPVFGVDVSMRMLHEGRRKHATTRIAAADLIDLPFREASFDVVTANFVLPEATRLDTALHDMIRVIRPGGVLAVSVWTEVLDDLTRTWRDLATARLGPELLRDALKQGTPWAERMADAKHLEATLRDAGLRPVRVQKKRYRNEMTRDDFVRGKEVEVIGRYLHRMLGEDRWRDFLEQARATYEQHFPERIVDFRDVLLAVGTKPT